MKLKCIGCEALARPVYLCAAQSPHIVDVELFQIGLHADPADLRQRLQSQIDSVPGQTYDAILLAYGLCGAATAGLTARDIPIIIPRAHDCITLFLGSRERYNKEFTGHPGTYWYALDYIERRDGMGTALSLGSGMDGDSEYDKWVTKFGKEKADYLMDVMGGWKAHYNRAVFIDMGVGASQAVEAQAESEAARQGWTFERVAGDLVLIRRLLLGDWEGDFLILEPGQTISMAYNDDVIGCLLQPDAVRS